MGYFTLYNTPSEGAAATRAAYFVGCLLFLASCVLRIASGQTNHDTHAPLFFAGGVLRLPASTLFVLGALIHLHVETKLHNHKEALDFPAVYAQVVCTFCFLGGSIGLVVRTDSGELPTSILWFIGSLCSALQTGLLLYMEAARAHKIHAFATKHVDAECFAGSSAGAAAQQALPPPSSILLAKLAHYLTVGGRARLYVSHSFLCAALLFTASVLFCVGTGVYIFMPFRLDWELLLLVGTAMFAIAIALDEAYSGSAGVLWRHRHFRVSPADDSVIRHAVTLRKRRQQQGVCPAAAMEGTSSLEIAVLPPPERPEFDAGGEAVGAAASKDIVAT